MSRPQAILLTADDAELLARIAWHESDRRIPWADLPALVQGGQIEAARDWITAAVKLCGSDTRDVELVPTSRQPRVEVVVYRDPGHPNDVVVFLDGHPVEAEVHNVNPGAAHELPDQRENAESAAVASPAAAALIHNYYMDAASSPPIADEGEDDELFAPDPFPTWEQVAEPYAAARANEQFVVTLVVGYDPDTAPDVTTPEAAATAALELTRDGDPRGTVWHVYDRRTGQTHRFEQSEFEGGDCP
jgi:hypothetical protein